MFGRYERDFTYSDDTISIVVNRTDTIPRYVRTIGDERLEKILPEGEGRVIINPVEPVNLPVPISRHLEISFPAVVLNPKGNRSFYLTFPIEIGVFLESGGSIHVLDLFSRVRAKYSLYGLPGAGLITRWHRSGIHNTPPSIEKYSSGILELSIKNTTPDSIEVSRTVIDSGNMHLFYGDYVAMAADMEVFSPVIARTFVRDKAPVSGMQQSIELYMARKIPAVHGRGFLMEFGVA